jgi:phosphonate transport system substrate-binding protein
MKRAIVLLLLVPVMLVALGAPAAQSEPEQVLTMGIIPLEAPRTMYAQFTPLAKYLSEELGVKVRLMVGKDYQATMDAMGQGLCQFAYLTPTTYPKCRKQNPDADVRPLVRFLKKGKGTYRSCIIVAKDSTAKTVADLKGGKFAFGSKDSTSSHLMPRSMIVGAGLDIDKDLAVYKYLGSHTNAAMAVKNGAFDAAGVKESVANDFQEKGFARILAVSADIPEFPICVSKHLSPELVAKLEAALLKLSAENEAHKPVIAAINKKYTGCEKAVDADYEVIRGMIKNLYGDSFYARK